MLIFSKKFSSIILIWIFQYCSKISLNRNQYINEFETDVLYSKHNRVLADRRLPNNESYIGQSIKVRGGMPNRTRSPYEDEFETVDEIENDNIETAYKARESNVKYNVNVEDEEEIIYTTFPNMGTGCEYAEEFFYNTSNTRQRLISGFFRTLKKIDKKYEKQLFKMFAFIDNMKNDPNIPASKRYIEAFKQMNALSNPLLAAALINVIVFISASAAPSVTSLALLNGIFGAYVYKKHNKYKKQRTRM
ncbi:hypothetical protein HEP_00372000 [Hepatocystis sp. ex Piliocolobus tephrosceles]|nr:hypothetical protein HEP_00372000 [Hepatocystis sp. ex Piliocolobus tephrosceles]